MAGQRAFNDLARQFDPDPVDHHFEIPINHYATPHGYNYPPTRVPAGESHVLQIDNRVTRYYVHIECGTFNNFSIAAIKDIIVNHGGRPYANPRTSQRPRARNSVFVIGDNPSPGLLTHIEDHNCRQIGYAELLRQVIAAVGEEENDDERYAHAFRETVRVFQENQAQHNEEAEDSEEEEDDSEEDD